MRKMKELKERMKKYSNEKGIDYNELVNQSVYDVNPVFSEEIIDIACGMAHIDIEKFTYNRKLEKMLDKIANELLA